MAGPRLGRSEGLVLRTGTRTLLLSAVAPLAAACTTPDSGTLQLVTGEETDTFTRSPQPTKIAVYAVDPSGTQTTLATASLPTSSIDLGNQNEAGIAMLQVVATDANGNELVFGQSLALQYGALAGAALPVFVQRTGEWARLPSPPSDTRREPTLAVVGGRYVFAAGGTDASTAQTTQLYDFATLATLSEPPVLPRAPLSMPVIGTVALLIDGAGGTYFDLSQNTGFDVEKPPTGFTFGDVAGGQSIYDVDASGNLQGVYVVGATRTQGSPTAAVLFIDPNDTSHASYPTGALSWITLTAPRLGATASWVEGRGLVVTGGSASGAGVEIVAPKATQGSALAYPPDASIGAGAAPLDPQHVLVAGGILPTGGDAGVREIDLGCTMACGSAPETVVWGPGLPVALTGASAFATGGGASALVVGSELKTGVTHAFVVTSTAAKEVPFKVTHTGARAVASPIGSVVVYGGADEIESFWPNGTM